MTPKRRNLVLFFCLLLTPLILAGALASEKLSQMDQSEITIETIVLGHLIRIHVRADITVDSLPSAEHP